MKLIDKQKIEDAAKEYYADITYEGRKVRAGFEQGAQFVQN